MINNISRAIIGGLIIESSRCLPIALEAGIEADLFDVSNERIIFEEILSHYQLTGKFADEIQLMDLLSFHETWDHGLMETFNSILIATETTAGFSTWILHFVDERKQAFEIKAYESYKTIKRETPLDEVKRMHNSCNELLARKEQLSEAVSDDIDDGFKGIYEEMGQIIKGEKIRVYFSFHFLRDMYCNFGPIRKQEFVIIAARPGIGKSSLVNQAIMCNIRNGQQGVLFNFEMDSEEILEQFACQEGKHDSKEMRSDKRKIEDYLETVRQIEPLVRKNLKVFSSNENVMRMGMRLDMHVRKHGNPDFIVVDYLQLVVATDSKRNRSEQVGEISRTLKTWTGKYNCPVIALSQLNRAGESDGRIPRLSDLRESGSLEQDANRVIILHCPNTNSAGIDQSETPVQEVLIIQAKCRKGPKGKIKVSFKRCITKFFNFAAEVQGDKY